MTDPDDVVPRGPLVWALILAMAALGVLGLLLAL